MQNLIIDEITKAVWNEFTAKTHNEKRDYQYSVNDLRNVITEAYKNAEALQLQQTGVNVMLCGSFEPDNKTSSATKCKCGREKWEHPKPRN